METKENVMEFIIHISRRLTSLPIWAWVLIPLLSVFLLAISFSWLTIDAFSGNSSEKILTDAEMQITFNEKRDIFEKLVLMSDEDPKVVRISHNYTEVSGANRSGEMGKDRPIGFSDARWNEYKQLFKETGLKIGLSREEVDRGILKKGIYLISDTRGMLGGIAKGYLYKTERIDNELMVDSVDGVLKDIEANRLIIKNDYAIFYKKIAENWYIYAELD